MFMTWTEKGVKSFYGAFGADKDRKNENKRKRREEKTNKKTNRFPPSLHASIQLFYARDK